MGEIVVTIAGQNGATPPGSICATPVEGPVDVEDGLPLEIPIVFYYGHTTPEVNPELYKYLVERLATLLHQRTLQNAKVRSPVDSVAVSHCINTLASSGSGRL